MTEFERNLTGAHTNAGLSAARARGRTIVRPSLPEEKIANLRRLYADKNNTPAWICKTLGISRATLYRYAKDECNHDEFSANSSATR